MTDPRAFDGFNLSLYYVAGKEYGEAVVEYRGRQIARLPMHTVTEEEAERIVGRLAFQAARDLLPR